MKKCVVLIGCLLTWLLLSMGAVAQTNPTGSLTGVVTDPSGSSIPGAAVVVTSETTHRTYNIQSDISGRFALPNLSPDQYDVTISHAGFTTGSYKAVAIQVGQVYNINAKLKVGEATQTVEVNAGQQILETQSTTIANQVTGKQITEIPISSRNAQDLAIYLPAMQTTGSPRNSQFDGLPPGAVNMTFDGINSQDNLLKSTTGSSYFSTEQPRIDDVQEFSISTAATDASASGEGAVQVAIVSKKGTNSFHGGGWEYLRNDALNANSYFNNINGLPRQRLRLNEFGYKIGGYIIKNKLFFFTDLDAWQNPQGQLRSRNILTPAAAAGQYTYTPTSMPTGTLPAWVTCSAAAGTCTADLFKMMSDPNGGNGKFTSVEDSIEAKIWQEVQGATTAPGVTLGAAPGLDQQQINFNAQAASHRYYPDVRLDYNINQSNSLEFDYHYAHYFDGPDILNNVDATYPVAPFNTNVGSQISNRNLMALAWRTQITSNMSNELRVGGQSAPLWFSAGQTDSIYPTLQTDTGTLLMRPSAPSLVSRNPFANFAPGSRNTALGQLNETLTWLHGNHAMSMGGTFTDVRLKDDNAGEQVAPVTLGLNSDDPAIAEFTAANLPGMGSNDLSLAENLYGTLAGHVQKFSQTINVNPITRAFQANYNSFDQISQREFSTFFSDSWHVSPSLTFNYGLRWEWEGTPVDDLNIYALPVGGAAGVFGVSGEGNLFQPGTTPGAVTSFINDKGQTFYKADKNDYAPSVGLAWTPSASGGVLGKLFGQNGTSVIRAGYSIAYDREGLSAFTNYAPTNPGIVNGQFLQETAAGGVTPGSGLFNAGSILLQNQNLAGQGAAFDLTNPNGTPYVFGTPFGINTNAGDQVNAYDPALAQPLIQSWSIGFQRQLDPNDAIEFDYIGNHGTREWAQVNVDESNIFESGFLTAFNAAVGNLKACNAVAACAKKPSFGNQGLSGQVNIPLLTAAFTGSATGSQADPNFSNGTFISMLNNGQAGAFANQFNTQQTLFFWQNLVTAGMADNLIEANPEASGGAFLATDLNQSTYNAFVAQWRRRLANNLQFNASYAYSHSFGTGDVMSLRNYGSYKAPSPSDLRNVFKVQSHFDLPFGPGHRWTTGNGWINTAIGGWSWDNITRWQSGNVFELVGGNNGANFSGETVNGNVDGVQLNGISTGQLQSLAGVSQQTNSAGKGTVFYAPNALLGSGQRFSNSAILGPCTTAGQFCQQPYLYGPGFFRADWSLQKATKLREGLNLTLRADFLDAFNNINFSTPAAGRGGYPANVADVTSSSFMRINSAYSDFTSTQDPGGRFIQLQARIDF